MSIIEEEPEVKRMWRRKWLVSVGAMVLFLSIGAAAWAVTGEPTDGTAVGPAAPVIDGVAPALAVDDQAAPAAFGKRGPLGEEAREALKEKRQQRIKRMEAVMKLVREKMTAEDQAIYDRLLETAKDQREALKQAREDLAKTLKELRELVHKYIDAEDAAAAATGSATSLQ